MAVLQVYAVRGCLVQSADLGALPAGPHSVALNASGLAPGFYPIRLGTASGQQAAWRLLRVE